MTVISDFLSIEFDKYVADDVRREVAARRYAELSYNRFIVRLDPEAGLATVFDDLDPDRFEVIDLDEFARLVEEHSNR